MFENLRSLTALKGAYNHPNVVFNLEKIFVDHSEGMVNFQGGDMVDMLVMHEDLGTTYP